MQYISNKINLVTVLHLSKFKNLYHLIILYAQHIILFVSLIHKIGSNNLKFKTEMIKNDENVSTFQKSHIRVKTCSYPKVTI